MSRNFIPAVLAIGVGVFTGYYTFQPTLQQLAIEKSQAHQPSSSSDLSQRASTAPINENPAKPELEKPAAEKSS